MLKADRDQAVTRKAVEAFEEVILVYPTGEYAARAREQIVAVRGRLAESDFLVGHFYFRTRRYLAAIDRFEEVVERYPTAPVLDKVLFFLGSAYARSEQPEKAETAFQRLREEFPESELQKRVPAAVAGSAS